MRTAVRTYTGKSVDLLNPDPAQICIEDIAHHLSQLNRYNGGCPHPFSVAQHSLYVAEILPPELKLWGLLHDAPEAYLGDLVSPAKRIEQLAAVFKPIEAGIMAAVATAFGLATVDYAPIKRADKAVQAVEMVVLNDWPDLVEIDDLPPLAAIEIEERPWQEVEREFMAAFRAFNRLCKAA
jgi:hypothetical protein